MHLGLSVKPGYYCVLLSFFSFFAFSFLVFKSFMQFPIQHVTHFSERWPCTWTLFVSLYESLAVKDGPYHEVKSAFDWSNQELLSSPKR